MKDYFKKLSDILSANNLDYDLVKIRSAYDFAAKAHENQIRETGEPYIIHPVEVASILAEFEFDQSVIIAALLHDVIEDTSIGYNDLKKEFGEEIAKLVDGVTKLDKISFTTKEELQVENLRKMFLAMAEDIRVVMIKLADRLHNMRTLQARSEDKQLEQAIETMEIYAPLAHRLGMSRVKDELEDLAFSYIDPRVYRSLKAEVAVKMAEGEKYVTEIVKALKKKLPESGHEFVKIEGRAKHLYSIYKKMRNENKTLDEIYDIFAVRIIVADIEECYSVLGEVHKLYTPVPGKFKDYIAMPKPNMYQSIHTTLFGANSSYFEVQIRTVEMHKVAEFGIAAHWKYKERGTKSKDKKNEQFDIKLSWLRQILDDQQNMEDDKEFMYSLKVDLFSDRVYVFTPKGDVKDLSAGSTPIDFAYSIHSAIGNKMSGAKINGRIATLDYKLKTGDVVEILTSTQTNGPSRDWLKIVKTAQARNKINQWFKKERKDENISRGREMVEREIKKHKFSQVSILEAGRVESIIKKFNFHNADEMYAAVGYGGISGGKIVLALIQEYKKTMEPEEIDSVAELPADNSNAKKKVNKANEDIVVKGIDNCLVRIARCCNPLPGDEIVGYITKGRGVTVHRADCKSLALNFEIVARRIEVDWGNKQQQTYVAGLSISASDRTHLLTDVTTRLANLKIPLKGINAKVRNGGSVVMHLDLEIDKKEQLDDAIKELRKLDGVYDVVRS